jgi:DNA-binding NtrC family response regulator
VGKLFRVKTVPTSSLGTPIKAICVHCGDESLTRDETITIGTASTNDLVIVDEEVSAFHLELRREGERVRVVDLGSTNGTLTGHALFQDTSVAASPPFDITLGATRIRVIDGAVSMRRSERPPKVPGMIGITAPMIGVRRFLVDAAPTKLPVLITGESGTGKEVAAKALHELSGRGGAFVTFDCGAISPNLVTSELFGHEKGAFTGATRTHRGAIERAEGGTLFLDEIGELPLEHQTALLGVLERAAYTKVGGDAETRALVRVVAATNRELRGEVNAGRFRQDLYYRLAVLNIRMPPLRDRRDDIPLLIDHLARTEGFPDGQTILASDAWRAYTGYRWPGNVRELRNVVAAILAVGYAPEPQPETEVEADGSDSLPVTYGTTYKRARGQLLARFEARYLEHLLERADGSVRAAARIAKMDRSYLTELLDRHGLR